MAPSPSGVSPAEVRSALRAVLRAVDRHLTPVSGNQQWRKEVLARFRAPASTTEEQSSASASASASSGASPAPSGIPTWARPIAPSGSAPTPAQAIVMAREWAALAENIAKHKELLLSYNIGLDVDERTKKMIEATARRVGFALPDAPVKPRGPRGGQGSAQG
ncbi:hypothetical protein HYH03_006297 [Edaphochlamys debaryana]|uniref:Uncharacterized protein n=1 Tax=Edaphochlamys debaryana TaxID=47281 RepID=A0A835Y5X7_9CHLO|nr:hypothetical protein HYH03_006297 [Edaphochlamys debaryana]|eukprot:KAG2495697.1 hypothetical protein HYH03_006297 [Edaphochlamys debaryana]